uniref:Palmitoyltransferase n=1 Tax=Latimeria chalumnae TaxID=7897 RepID=H3B897_LATCH
CRLHGDHGHHGHRHGQGSYRNSGVMELYTLPDQVTQPSKRQEDLTSIDDCTKWDIVTATQHGIIDRCKELIEAGYDVRQPDKENVTLLHWAAINNRLELVRYYISQGAIVDQLGGDLKSTPLHWAIRQGHLSMVVLLMECGADPLLVDGEGFSGLHLAVQCQHMPIMAYLIAKGQDIDLPDMNGFTPLMLSAQKIIGPEPTGFLLKFNPSLSAVDKLQKNTPLHWAVISHNNYAVHLLLKAGANANVQNAKGQTPLDVAYQMKDTLMIHMLAQQRWNRNSRIFRTIVKYKLPLLLLTSCLFIKAIGYILDMNSDSWLLKGVLLAFVFLVQHQITRECRIIWPRSFLPCPWILRHTFAESCTSGMEYIPSDFEPVFQISFMLSVVGVLYYFYKTSRTDPGYIKVSEVERKQNIIKLAEAGCLDPRIFCSSCTACKTFRSVHCPICDSCVTRFDQHCMWTACCIVNTGAGNHQYYIGFLVFLSMLGCWIFYGTAAYWSSHCETTFEQDGLWTFFTQIASCSPWVVYIFVLTFFHTLWATLCLLVQLYQIALLGLTSEERIRLLVQNKRCKHTVSLRQNPFNRGCIQNLVDFFQCRCFGLFKPNVVDWSKQNTKLFEHPKASSFQYV